MTEEFMVGHTRIRIFDDYCAGMTEQDIEKTLESIVMTARRHLRAAAKNGQNENSEETAAPKMRAQHKNKA